MKDVAIDPIREFDLQEWSPDIAESQRQSLQTSLEHGAVLYFPRLGFEFHPHERRFLTPGWSDQKSKNINLRAGTNALRGAAGQDSDLSSLREMIARYAALSEELVRGLFPGYLPHCRRGGTSFRPHSIDQHKLSWRKDDTRLHVDAFPSNPNRGLRLLRVFTNVNPQGVPRIWRVGEPFKQFAEKFISRTTPSLPASAWLLYALKITKSRRSEYDHVMLQLHDQAKGDLDYQRQAPQTEFAFPPNSTWVVFSDQVLHAAMSGQFMFEQTFYLDPKGLADRNTSPLAILEQIKGCKLV